MGQKRAILWAIGGAFIMFSFFLGMNLGASGGSTLPPEVVGIISAAVGFYILGYSLDLE